MSEIEADEDLRGCWKDIIVLLRGDLRAGATASLALADVLNETELPEVFHELCTRYLISKEWMSRTNAGSTIKNLCQKYASVLTPLVTISKSDGELLTLSELDIAAVSSCTGAELLSGSNFCDSQIEGSDLYSKSWLRKQRKALRKRLGLETLTADIAVAEDHIFLEVLVDDGDLISNPPPAIRAVLAPPLGRQDTAIPEETIDTLNCNPRDASDADRSTETWFAR